MGVPVGTVVAVAYERAGRSRQTLVYLDERPKSPVEHALNRDIETSLFAPLFGMQVQELSSGIWRRDFRIESVYSGSVADETGLSAQDPFTLQDWIVDTDRRVVVLRISIRQRKAGFITRGIQLIGLLDPDNFI